MAKNKLSALAMENFDVTALPTGTALPTSATSVLPAGGKNLGLFSDEGINLTKDVTETAIYASNRGLVRTFYTEGSYTFAGTLLQTDSTTLAVVTGNSAVNSTTKAWHFSADKAPKVQMVVLDGIDESRNKLVRIVIPEAEINYTGDTNFTNKEIMSWAITFKGLPTNVGGEDTNFLLFEADVELGE